MNGAGDFKSIEEMMQVAFQRSQALPPDVRAQFLRDLFTQKIVPSPWFQQQFPTPEARYQVARDFGVDQRAIGMADTAHGGPSIGQGQERGFLGRVFDRSGIENPLKHQDPLSRGVSAAGTAFGIPMFPFRAIGEAVDTAAYDMRGKQRPTPHAERPNYSGGALMPSLPASPGAFLDRSVDLATLQRMSMVPAVWRALGHIPGATMRTLRNFGRNINEGRQAAEMENVLWEMGQRPQKALPPIGGTVQRPHAMGPSSLPQSQWPQPGHAPRPGSLQPRRNGPPQGAGASPEPEVEPTALPSNALPFLGRWLRRADD